MNLETTKKRFYNNILKIENGCWEWQKSRNLKGYGYFQTLGQRLAHRVSYIIHNGEFDKKLCVLHRCDNPPCVNPDHLFLGTVNDNNKDRHAKGRTVTPNHNFFKTHCKRGHEFNKENTYVKKNGGRECRKCITLRRKGKL